MLTTLATPDEPFGPNHRLSPRRRRLIHRLVDEDVQFYRRLKGDPRTSHKVDALLDEYRQELLDSLRRHLEAHLSPLTAARDEWSPHPSRTPSFRSNPVNDAAPDEPPTQKDSAPNSHAPAADIRLAPCESPAPASVSRVDATPISPLSPAALQTEPPAPPRVDREAPDPGARDIPRPAQSPIRNPLSAIRPRGGLWTSIALCLRDFLPRIAGS